jgi:hypothetical protein
MKPDRWHPLVAVLLLSACSPMDLIGDDDPDLGPPGPDAGPPDPGDGDSVDEAEPFFLFERQVKRLAAGTDVAIPFETSASGYRVFSRDPAVVTAFVEADMVRLSGRAPGRTTLVAAAGGRILAQLALTVVEVEAVEFRFRTSPVAAEAIDDLAAMVDSSDSIRVIYRSADGEALSGRGSFSASGAAEVAPLVAEDRISEHLEAGQRVGVRFGEQGMGELSAGLADGRSFSIPIQVVAAPARIDVVTMALRGDLVAADVVEVGELVVADVVGRTEDGRFVAGVSADWSLSDPVDDDYGSLPGSEVFFTIPTAAAIDVTAVVSAPSVPGGTLTATRQVTAQ